MQRCKLADPLRYSNGAVPCNSILNERILPGVLTTPYLQEMSSKNDMRLRIFSGTSNPALSQVDLFILGKSLFIFFLISYEVKQIIN